MVTRESYLKGSLDLKFSSDQLVWRRSRRVETGEDDGLSPSVNLVIWSDPFCPVSPHQVTSVVSPSLVTAICGPQQVSQLFTKINWPRDIVTCDAECHEDFGPLMPSSVRSHSHKDCHHKSQACLESAINKMSVIFGDILYMDRKLFCLVPLCSTFLFVWLRQERKRDPNTIA